MADDDAPFDMFGWLAARLGAFAAGREDPEDPVCGTQTVNSCAHVAGRPAGPHPDAVPWPVQFTMFLQTLT